MQLRIFVLMCISTFFKGMRDLCLQETVNGCCWCVMISAYPRSYILGHTHLYTDTNTHIHGVTCTNSYKPTYKSHTHAYNTLFILAERPDTGCWRVSSGSSTIILRSDTSSQPNYGSSPYPLFSPGPLDPAQFHLGIVKAWQSIWPAVSSQLSLGLTSALGPDFLGLTPRPYFLGPSLVPR